MATTTPRTIPAMTISNPQDVTLVIPAYNTADTLEVCLAAVAPLVARGDVKEIIVVDDGSTDNTAEIARRFPVRLLAGEGKGAAAARNRGWLAATTELIWFIDADCVAEDGALARLRTCLDESGVAGVGGSYGNMLPDSLVATLIHEEIIDRHLGMSREVNVLATFNVLYRRHVLEEVGGFDPDCFWAHDAELAYRICKAGYRLRFEASSRVGHFHPQRLFNYFAKQRKQGFYRIWLYWRHPERMSGDSYSHWGDFIQPPLAILTLMSLGAVVMGLPFGIAWWCWLLPLTTATLLLAAQLAPTLRIVTRTRRWQLLSFAPFGFLRAFWRGIGMTTAISGLVFSIGGKLWPKRRSRRNHDIKPGF